MIEIENLRKALQIASDENEFPDYLKTQIASLISNYTDQNRNTTELIELTEMVEDYDPYGDTGCFNTAVSPAEIETVINKLLNK